MSDFGSLTGISGISGASSASSVQGIQSKNIDKDQQESMGVVANAGSAFDGSGMNIDLQKGTLPEGCHDLMAA